MLRFIDFLRDMGSFGLAPRAEREIPGAKPIWVMHAGLCSVVLFPVTKIAMSKEVAHRIVVRLYPYIPTIFGLLPLVGTMAAIVGLHAVQRERYGLLGALASLIAFAGVAIILVGALLDVVAGQRYPVVASSILSVGILVGSVGLLALGSITIIARVLPWWCGALTILGSPFFARFLFFFAGFQLSESLVGVAWGLVGYALLREAGVRQAPQHDPRA